MALADANYQFLYVDVGAEDGTGDAGTWARCKLHTAIIDECCGFLDQGSLEDLDRKASSGS